MTEILFARKDDVDAAAAEAATVAAEVAATQAASSASAAHDDKIAVEALVTSFGTAAFENVEDFASAAQGAKADTAIQPADLADVAVSGDYNDLNGKPGLGSASALDVGTGPLNVVQLDISAKLPAVDGSNLTNLPASSGGLGDVIGPATNTDGYLPQWNGANSKTLKDGVAISSFATATQGSTADTAVQPGDLATVATTGDYVDLINTPTERTLLIANVDYYVDNDTGSNSNPGTLGDPFATLQYAWDHLRGTLDLAAFGITIHLVGGTGTVYELTTAVSGGWVGGSYVFISGEDSATTTLQDLTMGYDNVFIIGPPLYVNGVTLTEVASGYIFYQTAIGQMNLGGIPGGFSPDLVFGSTVSENVMVAAGGSGASIIINDHSIDSSAFVDVLQLFDGAAIYYGSNLTVVGSLPVGIFANATGGARLNGIPTLSSGTVTGKRFSVSSNAIIDADGDVNAYPGDAPGTIESGGQYLGITDNAPDIVANLPSAEIVGAKSFVTDALAPVFGATVVGGGALFTPVYSDGTNWIVG